VQDRGSIADVRLVNALVFGRLVGAALAAVLAVPAAAPPPPSPETLAALAHLKQNHELPIYYLGTSYQGMSLVFVEDDVPAGFVYADCSEVDLETYGLDCHHVVAVMDWPPIPGEISTQGRCTFATTIRGATAAFFPVNSHTLRLFTRGTTVWIGSESRRAALAAARRLRGLNVELGPGQRFPHRDVHRALGHCRAPKPPPKPTPKQRYERRMRNSWTIQSAGTISLASLDPHAPDPDAVAAEFLDEVGTFPLLLRNEATRIERIAPPAPVSDLQAQLVTELRSYADDVDAMLELVRQGAWRDEQAFPPQRDAFEARSKQHSQQLLAIVHAFKARGYTIVSPPGD
jgi:hypothetical protein